MYVHPFFRIEDHSNISDQAFVDRDYGLTRVVGIEERILMTPPPSLYMYFGTERNWLICQHQPSFSAFSIRNECVGLSLLILRSQASLVHIYRPSHPNELMILANFWKIIPPLQQIRVTFAL